MINHHILCDDTEIVTGLIELSDEGLELIAPSPVLVVCLAEIRYQVVFPLKRVDTCIRRQEWFFCRQETGQCSEIATAIKTLCAHSFSVITYLLCRLRHCGFMFTVYHVIHIAIPFYSSPNVARTRESNNLIDQHIMETQQLFGALFQGDTIQWATHAFAGALITEVNFTVNREEWNAIEFVDEAHASVDVVCGTDCMIDLSREVAPNDRLEEATQLLNAYQLAPNETSFRTGLRMIYVGNLLGVKPLVEYGERVVDRFSQ